MGLLNLIFKKNVPLLNQEDTQKLREIERKAYLEEAEVLMKERGKIKAKNDLKINQGVYNG